jgi:DNA-binding transcriptional LysR family regulator
MAASVAAVQASLMGANATATGVVRITASDVVAAYILPGCVAELTRRHPSIQVELVASNQITNLLRRDADIAVRMVRPTQANLIARKIGDLPIGLFVSRDYASARGVPQALGDLLQHSLVGLDRDDALIRALRGQGLAINREDFHVRTDNQLVYIQLIRSGVGVGVVPKTVGQTMTDLVEVLNDAPASALPVWLVVHREIHDSPVIRTVFDGLSEHLSAIIHDK